MLQKKKNCNIIFKYINKEASRLYAELCEPILKFFIFVIRNDPECYSLHTPRPIFLCILMLFTVIVS